MQKIEPNVGNEGAVRRVLFFALSAVNIAMGCWAIWAGFNDSAPLFALFDDPIPTHASFVPVFSLHLIVTGSAVLAFALITIVMRTFESRLGVTALLIYAFVFPNIMFLAFSFERSGGPNLGTLFLSVFFLLPLAQIQLSPSAVNRFPRAVAYPKQEALALLEWIKAGPFLLFLSVIMGLGVTYYTVVFSVLSFGHDVAANSARVMGQFALSITMVTFIGMVFVLSTIAAIFPALRRYNKWLTRWFGEAEYDLSRMKRDQNSSFWPKIDERVDGPIVKLTRVGFCLNFLPVIMLGLSVLIMFEYLEDWFLDSATISAWIDWFEGTLDSLTIEQDERSQTTAPYI